MKNEQIDQLIALAWCPMIRFRDVEPEDIDSPVFERRNYASILYGTEEQKNRARRSFVAGIFLMSRGELYLENAVKYYDDEQRKVIIEIPFKDVAKHMGYEVEE